MLSRDTAIGNYVVEDEIGAGGMARIYRVRHEVLGTHHALKVLEPAYRQQPELRARFLAEARIGAKLNHPNIVRVTDVISTVDVAGMVMELVSGPNLAVYLSRLTTPPTAEHILALFLPVLAAVGAAHQQGILHRDLKPANILLEPTGKGFIPKVSDFGIAKLTDQAGARIGQKASTHVDARMGTLCYMSPEQIRSAKDVTARSDIFSLGVTLYELATLRPPFDADSDYDVMHQIVEGRYVPVETIAKVDPAIAEAIRKALQTNPVHRFESCEQFALSLASAAQSQRVLPAPQPEVRTASRPAAQPTAPVSASAPHPSPIRPVIASRPRIPEIETPRGRRWLSSKPVLLFGATLGIGTLAWVRLSLDSPSSPASVPSQQQRSLFSGSEQTSVPGQVPLRQSWAGPVPFSGCIKSRLAQRVAVTYLTPERGLQSTDKLRSWFPNISASMIDVFLLERKNGKRLISFEIWRSKWPDWWSQATQNASGEEACWQLGKTLIDKNIGRPLAERLNRDGTAYEYDIFDVRNPDKYPQDQRLGDLDEALSPAGIARMWTWLGGLE